MRDATPTPGARTDRPRVLLIHGLGGFAGAWGGLPEALEAAGLAPHAVDLPGVAGAPMAGPCDSVAHMVALGALLDRLGPDVSLVGHSLGAQVALRLARARPGRVRRVVLVAPVVVPRPATRHMPRTPAELLLVPGLGRPLARAAIAVLRRDPSRRRAAFTGVIGERGAPPPGTAEARLLDEAAERLARVDLRCITDWAAAGLREGALDAAPAVSAPVLIVAGARDPLTPPAHLDRLAGALPSSRTLILAGVGHFPHLEAAGGVLPKIARHLAGDGAASFRA